VEHVVFQPKQVTPERLQEGLEWSWRQSYSWRSLVQRLRGAPWSILPLWVSLNLGYRFYARHLPEKTGPEIFRDPVYMAEAAACSTDGYSCRSKAQWVELSANLKNALTSELTSEVSAN
jgi:hypothetical protein